MKVKYKKGTFIFLLFVIVFIWHRYEYLNIDLLKKKKINKNLKIRVIMLCTPNYYDEGKAGIKFFKEYCQKYDYDFKLYTKKLIPDLHINFSKMKMLAIELQKNDVDYTLLTDADVIGDINNTIPLETLIEHCNTTCLSMPKDVVCGLVFKNHSLRIIQNSSINAGFIIGKNNTDAHKIMQKWIDKSYTTCKKEATMHPRNQNVFDTCILPYLRKGELTFIPWQIGGTPNSQIFRHLY